MAGLVPAINVFKLLIGTTPAYWGRIVWHASQW